MEVTDDLRCLYNAELEEQGGSYVIEVPGREVSNDQISSGEVYRVAVLKEKTESTTDRSSEPDQQTTVESDPEPPVGEGERRTVVIEDIGEQGDGIARVERGYVIIVSDTEPGDEVRVEIRNVQPNVAFAEVVAQQ